MSQAPLCRPQYAGWVSCALCLGDTRHSALRCACRLPSGVGAGEVSLSEFLAEVTQFFQNSLWGPGLASRLGGKKGSQLPLGTGWGWGWGAPRSSLRRTAFICAAEVRRPQLAAGLIAWSLGMWGVSGPTCQPAPSYLMASYLLEEGLGGQNWASGVCSEAGAGAPPRGLREAGVLGAPGSEGSELAPSAPPVWLQGWDLPCSQLGIANAEVHKRGGS